MNICDKPIHPDGLSTPQLLLPCLIELRNDFLSFLVAKLGQISKNTTHTILNYLPWSTLDINH